MSTGLKQSRAVKAWIPCGVDEKQYSSIGNQHNKKCTWCVIHDPCDAPLETGCRLYPEEVEYGLKYGAYVTGTILEHKSGRRFQIIENELEKI